jgi:uncharacterized protein YggE
MAAWKSAHAGSASWTVKGVQEATREAVREAAAQADMLLGEWVDYALRDAAKFALNPSPPPATREDVAALLKDDIGALLKKLDGLEARLAALANGMASAQALAELEARVRKLAERPGGYDRPAVRHVMVERKRTPQPPHPVIPSKRETDEP